MSVGRRTWHPLIAKLSVGRACEETPRLQMLFLWYGYDRFIPMAAWSFQRPEFNKSRRPEATYLPSQLPSGSAGRRRLPCVCEEVVVQALSCPVHEDLTTVNSHQECWTKGLDLVTREITRIYRYVSNMTKSNTNLKIEGLLFVRPMFDLFLNRPTLRVLLTVYVNVRPDIEYVLVTLMSYSLSRQVPSNTDRPLGSFQQLSSPVKRPGLALINHRRPRWPKVAIEAFPRSYTQLRACLLKMTERRSIRVQL